jgi:heme exporter protein C
MHRLWSKLSNVYWATTLFCVVGAFGMTLLLTPTDPGVGPMGKIAYLHVPVAINTLLACVLVFVGNVGYVWKRSGGTNWDDFAAAAAETGVLLCTLALASGSVWAHQAWGQWWVWSPLLTFSAALWALYAAYLVVRSVVPSNRREMACALYGLIAFLDVPLIYLSLKLLPDKHSSGLRSTPLMFLALLVCWSRQS